MARLRKPSVAEPSIFMPPPASPMRSTRSSPRRSAYEEPTRRELRYTSSYDPDDSILIPKVQSQETPGRKQRVLRPVASNSRLLRKLSNESLATPDRKNRRVRIGSGSSSLNHLYSKSLAKSVAKRQTKEKRPIEIAVEQEIVPDENEVEADQSIWCGGDGDSSLEENKENNIEATEEDDDEDPIVNARQRQRPTQASQVESDTDDDEDGEPVKQPRRLIRRPQKLIESDTEEDEEEDEIVRSRQHSRDHMENEMPPPSSRKGHRTISSWAQDVIDLTGSPEPPASFVVSQTSRTRTSSFAASSRPTSSASNDIAAVLHYSPTPTKFRSPRKAPPVSRPVTPPLPPPSPSKLVSPSKRKPAIPKAPELRPSLDAFWNPEVVNDWNEKHSPAKPLVSPRKQKWREDIEKQMNSITITDDESDTSFPSPISSPRKNKPQSPTKAKLVEPSSQTSTEVRAQRKDFAKRKHEIAGAFLAQLDKTITDGRITSLSSETGGIKLVWSKTLKTTAGRANWRCEQIRLRTGLTPSDIRTEVRHHCSIELAEKVIDDEERLYNVLAHEFCHLTTFMLSEVRNNPHGAEFKSWGRKVTSAFAHKGVEVTTKHSYKIDYKYVWECISCGYEFKRHSKSVDPLKHSCGRCKGKLVQTKPTPRGAGKVGSDGKKERSEYQIFVKENFARVKKELEAKGLDTQMGKVMEAVAKEYRELKGKDRVAEKEKVVDELEEALEGLKL